MGTPVHADPLTPAPRSPRDTTGPSDAALGIYVHLPFCRSKCPYCSFVSETGAEAMAPVYRDAIIAEYQRRRDHFPGSIDTLYIGGGTPSMLPAPIIATMIETFDARSLVECSIEANPDSLTPEWLDAMRTSGVTRISIGVQSFDDSQLRLMGRPHTVRQARDAVAMARRAGFPSVSVDLMFGLPGQSLTLWEATLTALDDCAPDHVSAYALGIEEDSHFLEHCAAAGYTLPDDDEVGDMYLMMRERFARVGLEWYELSNFARPGHECRHNQRYWTGGAYLGLGVAAHSFTGSERQWNIRDLHRYCETSLAGGDTVEGGEVLDEDTCRVERVMLALRTRQGLDPTRDLSGDTRAIQLIHDVLSSCMQEGYMTRAPSGAHILTPTGAAIADEILADIIAVM